MYARYTAFELDASDRERVPKFWSDVGGPSAARQPGFVQALITESNETPGRLRTVTVLRTREDFPRYYASDGREGAVGNLA